VPSREEPLQMNITEAAEPFLGHLVQHAERPITLKQLAGGQVVIGGGWPAAAAVERPAPRVELASMIGNLALARHMVPAIGGLHLVRSWGGVNTSVDGRAVLGGVAGVPGLHLAIPGDAGYTLGALCARLVADDLLGREPEVPIAPYSASRFATLALPA
jgi:glycine/D-amino acid oxidase-like deaminating enzyme